jgi:hypothetical protein
MSVPRDAEHCTRVTRALPISFAITTSSVSAVAMDGYGKEGTFCLCDPPEGFATAP